MSEGSKSKTVHARGNVSDKANALLSLALGSDGPNGDCPSAEQLCAWHEEDLDGSEARTVQHHVAHCDQCYSTWLELAAEEPSQSSDEQARPWATLLEKLANLFWAPRPLLGGVVALATVTALLFVLVPTDSLQYPPYDLSISGQVREIRGEIDPRARSVFGDGSRMVLLLRPQTPSQQIPAARIYLAQGAKGNRQRYVTLDSFQSQTSEKGVVRLLAVFGKDVAVPAGDYDVLLALGAEKALPGADELDASLDGTSTSHVDRQWHGWRFPIRIDRE